MTQGYLLPQQPDEPPEASRPVGPVAPHVSEATRLLCVGTYFDENYRDSVIDELYVHEERIVAHSLGFDASRVLAHALRALRTELAWAATILLLWAVSLPLTSGATLLYLQPILLLRLSSLIRGTADRPVGFRRWAALVLQWYGWLSFVLVPLILATGATVLSSLGPLGPQGDRIAGILSLQLWLGSLFPLVVATAVGMQRGWFAGVIVGELSRARFPDVASDPAEGSGGPRFRRLRERIRSEQHSPLVMYRSDNPFCGAGTPYDPWSFSVELRPRTDLGTRKPEPLNNRTVLDRIVPLLEALRVPSIAASQQNTVVVRDRLRELEVGECVFLPVDGLPSRLHVPYTPERFEEHRMRAVEEGGETRRHFLRVRVGGWGEEIVTTVFVRVHTQGGMLMLEVAPHVLPPLRAEFHNADRLAHQYLHNSLFGKAAWALVHTPRATGQAVVTLWRGLTFLGKLSTGGHAGALPDGPAVSVRELGSGDQASLFQQMDHHRYLKSIQDRVANGVLQALREAGWQTDEFEQKIVNVSNGAVFIESAQGAIGIGNNNTITNQAPQTRQPSGGERGNR